MGDIETLAMIPLPCSAERIIDSLFTAEQRKSPCLVQPHFQIISIHHSKQDLDLILSCYMLILWVLKFKFQLDLFLQKSENADIIEYVVMATQTLCVYGIKNVTNSRACKIFSFNITTYKCWITQKTLTPEMDMIFSIYMTNVMPQRKNFKKVCEDSQEN